MEELAEIRSMLTSAKDALADRECRLTMLLDDSFEELRELAHSEFQAASNGFESIVSERLDPRHSLLEQKLNELEGLQRAVIQRAESIEKLVERKCAARIASLEKSNATLLQRVSALTVQCSNLDEQLSRKTNEEEKRQKSLVSVGVGNSTDHAESRFADVPPSALSITEDVGLQVPCVSDDELEVTKANREITPDALSSIFDLARKRISSRCGIRS